MLCVLIFTVQLGRGLRPSRLGTILMLKESFTLCVLVFTVQLGRGLRPSRLGTVLMLRRRLHALRLDIYSAAGTRASTLAS